MCPNPFYPIRVKGNPQLAGQARHPETNPFNCIVETALVEQFIGIQHIEPITLQPEAEAHRIIQRLAKLHKQCCNKALTVHLLKSCVDKK